jgi:hypothetical protein
MFWGALALYYVGRWLLLALCAYAVIRGIKAIWTWDEGQNHLSTPAVTYSPTPTMGDTCHDMNVRELKRLGNKSASLLGVPSPARK